MEPRGGRPEPAGAGQEPELLRLLFAGSTPADLSAQEWVAVKAAADGGLTPHLDPQGCAQALNRRGTELMGQGQQFVANQCLRSAFRLVTGELQPQAALTLQTAPGLLELLFDGRPPEDLSGLQWVAVSCGEGGSLKVVLDARGCSEALKVRAAALESQGDRRSAERCRRLAVRVAGTPAAAVIGELDAVTDELAAAAAAAKAAVATSESAEMMAALAMEHIASAEGRCAAAEAAVAEQQQSIGAAERRCAAVEAAVAELERLEADFAAAKAAVKEQAAEAVAAAERRADEAVAEAAAAKKRAAAAERQAAAAAERQAAAAERRADKTVAGTAAAVADAAGGAEARRREPRAIVQPRLMLYKPLLRGDCFTPREAQDGARLSEELKLPRRRQTGEEEVRQLREELRLAQRRQREEQDEKERLSEELMTHRQREQQEMRQLREELELARRMQNDAETRCKTLQEEVRKTKDLMEAQCRPRVGYQEQASLPARRVGSCWPARMAGADTPSRHASSSTA